MNTIAIVIKMVCLIGGNPLPTIRQLIAVHQDHIKMGSILDLIKRGIDFNGWTTFL
jgi:hypothetical protein